MKKAVLTLCITLFCFGIAHAQVGINTTTPNAQLDIKSSNQAAPSNTDGLLIPKVDAFPVINPTAAQKGMLVYLNTVSGANQPGFYYWNNPGWIGIVTGTAGGTLDQAYNFGGAGLGKTITADAGAVTIAGTDGLVSTGAELVGVIPPSGAGTRMVWNPRRSAFRAGTVIGTKWDNASIGTYSTAFGYDTTASGSGSTASGANSTASGGASTALGSNVTASGLVSTAFGADAVASGSFSTAFGFLTTAIGSASTAYGRSTFAFGNSSTAFGHLNNAFSFGEVVLGIGATNYTPGANGDTQFGSANATDRLFTIGNAIDINNNSTVDLTERSDALIILKNGLTRLPSTTNAMITAADGKAVVTKEFLQSNTSGTLDQAYDFGGPGLGKTITADAGAVLIDGTDGFVSTGALGSGAIMPTGTGTRMVWNPRKGAFRIGTVSGTQWDDANVGSRSTAFGNNSMASGANSNAFGSSVTASGVESTAIGFGNSASGANSTAMGESTLASGINSTTFGFLTRASGSSSTTFGNDTEASSLGSTAFGFRTTASGILSTAFGLQNTASSYGETVLGIGATNYTLSAFGSTQFRTANATDRLLVVGNAIDVNNSSAVDLAERSDALVILKNGNTGIGSSTPQDKLHVVGKIRMVDGNQATGKILVSDANGTATWTTTSTIASGTLDQAYDFGGAGLGKTITADAGAVLIDGTDGLVSTGTIGSGIVMPTGGGTRMVWNPRKAAFRAGNVPGTQWDDANVGQRSTAFGSGRAGGSSSTAFGSGTFASGGSSTAFGGSTVASGDFSAAFGNNTISSGTLSTAAGYFNTAPSFAETVLGIGATVYTPSINGNINFGTANATDRLLVVGNASDANNDGAVDVAERSDAFVILKNGNTGIGISTPQRKLHVATGLSGVTPFAGAPFVVESSGDAYQHFLTPNVSAATGAGLLFGTPAGAIRGGIIYSPLAEKLDFRTGGNTVRMTLTNAGNLGIGTPTPLDKLHVVGNIRMVDGNQAAGNVMVSDANGTATWTAPGAGTAGTLDQSYDFGGAGAGRTITADAGAVLIDGTDGLVSTGTALGFGALAPSGAGIRMVWNPRRAAFRAGTATGTEWDDINIGFGSVAMGTTTRARGNNSAVMGFMNNAEAFGETVLGIGATTTSPPVGSSQIFNSTFPTIRLFAVGNAIDANNNQVVDPAERADALTIFRNGNSGFGVSTPVTRLQLATDSDATKTQMTQALPNSGLLITTDFVANNYTPGIFWNTTNNNVTKPKAGIYLQETNVGTNMYLGTSNNYNTGITNNAVVINQDGNVGLGFNNPQTALDIVGAITVQPFVSPLLTVDNQVVPVGTNGNIWLRSNSFVVGARTITLGNGVVAGQYLTLYNTGITGDFEVADDAINRNTNTPASRTLGNDDVITLMWTGTNWSEISFANN